jgi:nucleoid-associated protein YgaU
LRAVVVIVALLAVSRSRPGSAEVPPPIVRLERIAAAPPSTRPELMSATSYEVQKGDSLWRIARRSLTAESGKEPSSAEIDRFWRRIYEANRKLVGADPDLIHPGQRLQIPRR